MTAQMRFTLSDETAALLDAQRGPASRTAYGVWLLEQALRDRDRGATERPAPAAESLPES